MKNGQVGRLKPVDNFVWVPIYSIVNTSFDPECIYMFVYNENPWNAEILVVCKADRFLSPNIPEYTSPEVYQNPLKYDYLHITDTQQ